MKLIRLSLRIFKSYFLLTVLLCLEMIVSMVTFAVLYNSWHWGMQQVQLSYANDLYSSIYYVGPMGKMDPGANGPVMSISTENEKTIQNYLSGINGYLGRSHTSLLRLGEDTPEIQMIDDITAQRMKLPLASGRWFTDVTLDNGRIPCVVVDTNTFPTYHVGDVISGSPTQYYREPSNILFEAVKSYPDLNLEFQVVGVVDRANAFVLNDWSSWNSGIDVQPLQTIFSRLDTNSVRFLCGSIEGISQPSYIMRLEYFDPDKVNETQLQEIAQELSQYGSCYALTDMARVTQTEFMEQFQDTLPMAVTLLIVVLCSLICISLLNAKRQLQTFSIYQICGASWPKCIVIYAFYFVVLYAISCFIFSIYMLLNYYFDQYGAFYQYVITKEFIGVSALIFLAVAVLSVLPPFIKAFRQSPLNGYRKKE